MMKQFAKKAIEISEPEAYSCQVWSYRPNHSLLLIRAYRDDSLGPDIYYFLIRSVFYFDGTTSWQGAQFQLGTSEEAIGLLARLGQNADSLEAYFRLYKFITDRREIRILASDMMVTREIPDWFPWLQDENK
jgi:hypothetical protein